MITTLIPAYKPDYLGEMFLGLKRLLAKTTSAHELVNALATGDDLTMLVVRR